MPKTKTVTHKERINRPLLKVLAFFTFLLGVSSSFVLYLESDYFKTVTRSENITHFFIVAHALALVFILNWHKVVRFAGRVRSFIAITSLKAFILLLLAILPPGSESAWIFVIYITLAISSWVSLDILIETCSRDDRTGEIRGSQLTLENAGRLISPLFAGFLVSIYGFQFVFGIAFLIIFAIDIIALTKLKKIEDEPVKKEGILSIILKVSERKNVLRIFYIAFLLDVFYALMIIYTPLLLLDIGFSWTQIGQIFTIMLIPFVFIQYPAGLIADEKIEEREMIPFALLVMSFFTLLVFLFKSESFWLWAGILFATRVGASLIEILRDSYFYKRIDQHDIDVIEFFRSVRPMAYILSLLVAAPIVYYLGIAYVFPLLAAIVLTGIPVSLRLASSRVPPIVKCHRRRSLPNIFKVSKFDF